MDHIWRLHAPWAGATPQTALPFPSERAVLQLHGDKQSTRDGTRCAADAHRAFMSECGCLVYKGKRQQGCEHVESKALSRHAGACTARSARAGPRVTQWHGPPGTGAARRAALKDATSHAAGARARRCAGSARALHTRPAEPRTQQPAGATPQRMCCAQTTQKNLNQSIHTVQHSKRAPCVPGARAPAGRPRRVPPTEKRQPTSWAAQTLRRLRQGLPARGRLRRARHL